jgi:lipopolysaccharide export system permease protein
MPSIISRYLFRELLSPFAVNLLFFTIIFFLTKMLRLTDLIVNYHIGLGAVLLLLVYSVPYFLVFVLPMSVMMSILLTLMRMASDNEILALKAGGASLYRLLPPILVFAALGLALTLVMTLEGMPRGKLAIKQMTYDLLTSNVDVALKERTFSDGFSGVMLYVNGVDMRNRSLRDVFIEDGRDPRVVTTIVAPRGQLFKDPGGKAFRLRLFDGSINRVDLAGRTANNAEFATYDLQLSLKPSSKIGRFKVKDESEMRLGELQAHLKSLPRDDKHYLEAVNEWHMKFSVPIACLTLGLLAVPLGARLKTARRTAGLGAGLAAFLAFYVLMTAGQVMVEIGVLPPVVGLWAANGVTAVVGVTMLVHAAHEKPLWVVGIVDALRRRVLARAKRLGWLPPIEIASGRESGGLEPAVGHIYAAAPQGRAFHRCDCPAIRHLSPGQTRGFASREEALEAGLVPCRRCRP